ncbi:serine/threonine-protein kinase [Chiayiivirga flava]|uniref:non-specific serine/threonine protein kinase n=1 Tax=Chiayiivirga flava TaxID=659595 RepID=A0A7W8D4Z1_9GAMM|nr:serine/threonine-protein kinase [Chiayiivirga flava]MBB5206895.1 tetratricopeptide (TPR) repeat protein [Chiayiivirga flava]
MTAPGREFIGDGGATATGLLSAAEFARGDLVAARFRIERLLGMGGMGVVYQAHDEQLGIEVALKLLRPELASRPDAFERFRHELLLARQVSSPHVVRIHDLVQHAGVWLISMDFVPGRSLEQLLDAEGPLGPERALRIARQIALGLAAAHHRQVIHRDLKPANVLVTDTDEVLISDFGVARSAGATGLTLSGVIIGTPEYLSPEQARAERVDGRSDLYALGLILHEMLTGSVPFAGGTPAEMLAQRIVRSPPGVDTVKPGLPTFAVRLCARLLALQPAHRPQSADEVVRAIDAGALSRPPAASRRRAALLALALAVAALAGALAWRQHDGDGEASRAAVAPRMQLAAAVVPIVSGDAPDDRALALGLERTLALHLAAQGAAVADPLRTARALRELGLDAASAPRNRERLGAALRTSALLEGELVRDDTGLRVLFTLRDTAGGTQWQERTRSVAEESLHDELAALWPRIARRMGVQSPDATFPSPAALRTLARAWPLDTDVAWTPATGGDALAPDVWWWTLERLDRNGRQAEAAGVARAALDALGDLAAPDAARARWLARYLVGDTDAVLAMLDAQTGAPDQDHPWQLFAARALIAAGRYDDALARLRTITESDPRNVDAWFHTGKALLMQGDAQLAVDDALTRALVAANRQSDRRMQADVTNALGIGYRQLGQLDAAAEHFDKAARLRHALADARGEGTSLRNLATVHAIQGRFDRADAALAQARATLEPLGDPVAMADLVNDVGTLEEERGDFRKALAAYREALGFRQAQGDPGWIAESLINVGFAYLQLGEFDNAQVYLQQADSAYGSIDDRAGAIRARQGLGLAHTARGEFVQAREAIEGSLRDAETLQMPEEQATALAGLAELDRLEGHYAAALDRASRAQTMFESREDPRGALEMRLIRSAALADIGNYAQAQAVLVAEDPDAVQNIEQRALLQWRQGEAALGLARHDDALRLATEAIDTARAAGAVVPEIGAHLLRIRALAAAGRQREGGEDLAAARDGLARFASVPVRLLFDEAALASGGGDTDLREARALIARLPSYGRRWRVEALAARTLASADAVTEARAAAHEALARVAGALDGAQREALLTEARALGLEPETP